MLDSMFSFLSLSVSLICSSPDRSVMTLYRTLLRLSHPFNCPIYPWDLVCVPQRPTTRASTIPLWLLSLTLVIFRNFTLVRVFCVSKVVREIHLMLSGVSSFTCNSLWHYFMDFFCIHSRWDFPYCCVKLYVCHKYRHIDKFLEL